MTEIRYDLRRDNGGGGAPEILGALDDASTGTAAPCGDDDYTRGMTVRFASLLDRAVQVFPLCSGTGPNSTALAALAVARRGNPIRVRPFAVTVTQPTDFGMLHAPADLTCEGRSTSMSLAATCASSAATTRRWRASLRYPIACAPPSRASWPRLPADHGIGS